MGRTIALERKVKCRSRNIPHLEPRNLPSSEPPLSELSISSQATSCIPWKALPPQLPYSSRWLHQTQTFTPIAGKVLKVIRVEWEICVES